MSNKDFPILSDQICIIETNLQTHTVMYMCTYVYFTEMWQNFLSVGYFP